MGLGGSCGKLVLSVITILLFFSCSNSDVQEVVSEENRSDKNEKYTGLKTSHYPDGKILSEVNYVNGRRNGLSQDYYKNGQKRLILYYQDGVKHGESNYYYQSGVLYQKTSYVEGLEHGVRERFYESGNKQLEMYFDNGNECFGLKEYNSDGSVINYEKKILLREVNDLIKNNTYKLEMQFEKKRSEVQFYVGELKNECLDPNFFQTMKPVETDKNGVAKLVIPIPKGSYLMKKLDVVGIYKSYQGYKMLCKTSKNIYVENKY